MTDLVLLLEHNSVNLQISVGIVGTEHKRGATDSSPLHRIIQDYSSFRISRDETS